MIGDNMSEGIRLLDLDIKSFNIEEKRFIMMLLDIFMKKCHEKNLIITSFDPKDIYYENGMFSFKKVSPISPINSDDKQSAIFNNIVSLSTLGFSLYLPDYDLKNGLLNSKVVSQSFEKFKNLLSTDDYNYYLKVFNAYSSDTSSDVLYYYDYIENVEKNNTSNNKSNSRAYIKATEAGKLYADQQEAAFGSGFFFATVVTSLLILLIGFIAVIIKYI